MDDETVEINLSDGEAYAFATLYQRNALTEDVYQVRVKAIGNAALASLYVAQYIGRDAMQKDQMSGLTVARIGGDEAELVAASSGSGTVQPWVASLYQANIRVCRSLSRSGGFEVPRPWMKDLDPYKAQPGFLRAAGVNPVIVTAGLVAVAAAVSIAVAWWARGRDEARAGVETVTIRQQAAVSAATRVAMAYVAAGKPLPPELIESITLLGGGESARAWAVPFALAAPIAAGVGVTAWQLLKPKGAKAAP